MSCADNFHWQQYTHALAETSKNALQSQLQQLQSSSTTSNSETSALKARITSLESSNRDTLSLLASKTAAHDELASELREKHQKTIQLKSEVSRLEQTAQATNSAATSAKFREHSLQQEIDSLRRTNEWLDKELKTRSEEHTKFRKEKSAVISELQRGNEESISAAESLKRTEQTLRSRLNEVQQKADEFLTQANTLRDEANRKEEMFRAELDTANRLADLMKQQSETEKHRHQDLSEQLEQTKDDAAEEISRIQAEVETEHQERQAAEAKVAELEAINERLESDVALAQSTATQAPADPQTPRLSSSRRGTPVPDGTPSRFLSPGGGLRGGFNYTQLLSDYHSAKQQLDSEKRRNQNLSNTVEEMIRDMEVRQPEILELQTDHKRLEDDILTMSNLVDSVGKERDEAKKDTRKWERETTGLIREGDILRQQLRDLSSQIKVLLVEFHSNGQGFDAFTPDERVKLEMLAKGDLDNEDSDGVTDTDRFISQHLTTFRNVSELQEQNTKLLRLTRELGDRMEGEEAQAQRSQATQNQEELQDLRQKYERCKDEIKSLITQSKSYMQERDMFRRMLSHKGQISADADINSMFGQSINTQPPATPSRNGAVNSIEQSPSSKDMADYSKLLKEMQVHFDNYRQESATDRSMLKEQLNDLTKKNSDLRNDLSRKIGEVTLISERYEMLQGNFNMLKSENAELQKKSQTLSERGAIQDIRAQGVTEDLVQTKGLLESMRGETANLKAEKEFWKSVEKRLLDDNQTLLADRDRLNALNSNMQNLLNEREHADIDTRRRLQSQAENLESELTTTKRRLSDEIEEHKRNVMLLKHESTQAQTQKDDLMTSLSSIREEMVTTKTTRDHLQSKVDEMTIELRSAEERLEVLQQRPAPNNQTAQGVAGEGPVNREQELAMEVLELKRDLELVQSELASSKTQIEQYKAISQDSEEELRSFTETQEQYRQEMDAIIEERESKIKSFEQNSETLRNEISQLNSELSSLRTDSAQHKHKLEDQRTEYENKISDLKDQCDRVETAAKFHQEDLKAQAEIARQAQQNYENELMKHADAAKTVQLVRAEYHELKLEIMELRTSAKAAQTQLIQNQESWGEAKERYEGELAEIKSRRDDISTQNKLLHQQLEDMNKQMADLQKTRRESPGDDNEESTGEVRSDTSNLQELIRYLRREKEIVDVQLDLSSQEAKRLRQQLNHTHSQLEDTRLKLLQQRRAEEDSERQALNHKKLMDTIEELNLNRESNSALRLEKNQLQTTLSEKLSIIDDLQAKIQPLQAKVTELEGLNESMEQDLRLAQEARARFEQRYLDVLHRSDSVDPAELEKVKEQVTALESERDELARSKEELQVQVNGFPDQIKEKEETLTKQFTESRGKIIAQAKERDRVKGEAIKEKDNALTVLKQERDMLQQQVHQLQSDLEQAKTELSTAVENAATQAKAAAEAQARASVRTSARKSQESEEGEVQENTTLESANNVSAAELSESQQKLATSEGRVSAANARILDLESEVVSFAMFDDSFRDADKSQNDTRANLAKAAESVATLQSSLQAAEQRAAQKSPASATSTHEASSDETQTVSNLQQELAKAQEETEAQRANALVHESAGKVQVDAGSPSILDQIATQVAEIKVELTNRHDERVRQAEARFNSRAENMKSQLSQKLSTARNENNQKLEAAVTEATNRLKTEHAQEIQSLTSRHQAELEELKSITTSSQTQTDGQQTGRVSLDLVETETQTLDLIATLTEPEIKEVLQKSAFARKLVSNSLTNSLNRSRVEHEKLLNDRLADAEAKANQQKQQAVDMEGKKFSLKVNMTENRLKAVNAKWIVVEQAAKDTPEKAVSEVWDVAKDAKPVPATAASQARPATAMSAPTTQTVATQATASTPATDESPKTAESSATTSTQPNSTSTQSTPAQPPTTQSAQPNPFAAAAKSLGSNPFAQAANSNGVSGQQSGLKPPSNPPSLSASSHAPTTQPQPAPNGAQANTTRKLPDQPFGAKPAAGTGPAAPRNISNTGIPVPNAGAGAGRGSGIPQPGQARGGGQRGRGRGGPRGGLAQVNTAQAQASQGQGQQGQAAGSPKNRQMSATAQQFVPKKRTADDSGLEASQYASGGEKKAKSSGGN